MKKEKLKELQAANLPHATPEVFRATITSDAPDRVEAEKSLGILAEYLQQFVPPGRCIGCDSPLGAKDLIHSFLTGATFVWGIAHGEGHCSKCGYPARAHHFVGDPEILSVRNFILQYHPSQLEVKQEESDDQAA